jgi:hypothetical protein
MANPVTDLTLQRGFIWGLLIPFPLFLALRQLFQCFFPIIILLEG